MATSGTGVKISDRAAGVAAVVVLVILVALAVSAQWLRHPYYEIDRVVGYVFMFGLVVYQLRVCYRVATTSEQKGKLTLVSLFLGLKAMSDVLNLELVFRSDRKFVQIFTDIGLFLALYYALVLVEMLLKKPAEVPPVDEPFSAPSG